MPDEAGVVRQVFAWVGRDRMSVSEAARRLTAAGVPTRTGRPRWDPSVVWGMLKNPAYAGRAAYGKRTNGPVEWPLRPRRGSGSPPRKPYTSHWAPPEEWIAVPVPALVPEALFAAAQEQLAENRRRRLQHPVGGRYLLQGLVVCARCGYCYYGRTWVAPPKPGAPAPPRLYDYYRCLGSDGHRFGGTRVCDNPPIRGDRVEAAVWQEVVRVLEQPERVAQEYRRRRAAPDAAGDAAALQARHQIAQLRRGLGRLIDGYSEGLLEKDEFAPRLARLRARIAALEEQARSQAAEARLHADLARVAGRLEAFAARVREGLAGADWAQRREILEALVKRVEVDHGHVTVVFRIGADSPTDSGTEATWQHHPRRVAPAGGLLEQGQEGRPVAAPPLAQVAGVGEAPPVDVEDVRADEAQRALRGGEDGLGDPQHRPPVALRLVLPGQVQHARAPLARR